MNDLAVGGAIPLYLSCSVIIEEGLPVDNAHGRADHGGDSSGAGVKVVTGDTKVVERGACDKLFINTAGVGVIREGVDLGVDKANPEMRSSSMDCWATTAQRFSTLVVTCS